MNPMGSFSEAIEHARGSFEHAAVVAATSAKAEADEAAKTDPAIPIAIAVVPAAGASEYSVIKGLLKTALPVLSGAGTVAAIALLDYILNTNYLAGKMSPIAVIGVTAAARFVQNYLKQAKAQAQAQAQESQKE